MRTARLLWATTLTTALGLMLGTGCVDYNDPCSGLVEEAEETVGYVHGRVFLDKNNARHANNAIGRLAAEAFVEAFPDDESKPVFGFINGGSIRNEGGEGLNGQCLTRNILGKAESEPPTRVTNGDIHQILLFENFVYAVNLTERELYQVLEHSAAALAPVGSEVVSPSGRFLHVAGRVGTDVSVRIDCTRPVAIDTPGAGRVTEVKIGSRVLSPSNTTQLVRVAMPEFLLRGNDGYSMLAPLRTDDTRNVIQSQMETGLDNDLTAAWMKKTYGTEDAALHSKESDRTACATAEGTAPGCVESATQTCCKSPVKLVGCAVPPAPSAQ